MVVIFKVFFQVVYNLALLSIRPVYCGCFFQLEMKVETFKIQSVFKVIVKLKLQLLLKLLRINFKLI